MATKEEIEVLYNACYGGWAPSRKANKLYDLRKNDNSITYSYRSDPVLIQVFHELGDEFDEEYSKTRVKTIPKKYEYCYKIEEYDGLEMVIIDYSKYELDEMKKTLKEILENTINNDEKINRLQELNE